MTKISSFFLDLIKGYTVINNLKNKNLGNIEDSPEYDHSSVNIKTMTTKDFKIRRFFFLKNLNLKIIIIIIIINESSIQKSIFVLIY